MNGKGKGFILSLAIFVMCNIYEYNMNEYLI